MVAITTVISSSRPSAAILIISSRSMDGPCCLLTQGLLIDHLSSDAELKSGSYVADPAHTLNTRLSRTCVRSPATPDRVYVHKTESHRTDTVSSRGPQSPADRGGTAPR